MAKLLNSRLVEEMRQVVALGKAVQSYETVDEIRLEIDGVINRHPKAAGGDVALALVLSVRRFCERQVGNFIKDQSTRTKMAEMFWAAMLQAIQEGCDVTLLND